MLKRFIVLVFIFFSVNTNAITLNEFSEKLIETHPFFIQLSLSEKTSLLDQKASLTYSDWNIKAGAGESFSSGEDTSTRLYKDLYTTSYEVSVLLLLHSISLLESAIELTSQLLNQHLVQVLYLILP